MEPEYSETAAKNVYSFAIKKDGPPITIRSDFDSGNAGSVELGLNSTIVISPAHDCTGTQYESHAKGWFHFAVSGAPVGLRQKFVIKKLNQLGGQAKFSDYFRPVYKYAAQNWERLEQAVVFNKEEDTELHFQFRFQKNAEIFFAYSYPFSYTQCETMLAGLRMSAKLMKNIYYHDQILTRSVEGRNLHLITISSHDRKVNERESIIDHNMFPGDKMRSHKFQASKKIVLISARVHPGEAPSSHTMNGILKFLISKDARADLLRKHFVFKIVPMLNPDGVYHGHYRMDRLNQNLNRFYLEPNPYKQPSAYALLKLGEYYKLEQRQCFYLDLHAHPQKKGNFIYGNSLQNKQQQIETQLFPKLLSLNCVQFDYENSCFSKNHMSLKDRNEDLTKQGCGRVVFHKNFNQLYSYTMECGYTCSNYFNELSPLTNPHRKHDKMGIIHDEIDNVKCGYYCSSKQNYLTIRSYENLGRCILISILDLFDKNPYSRIPNSTYKSLAGVRNAIEEQINKANKQYKTYLKSPLEVKKIERKQNNQTQLLAKSIPKAFLIPVEKKIFSSKILERLKQKSRRRTLPKMRSGN